MIFFNNQAIQQSRNYAILKALYIFRKSNSVNLLYECGKHCNVKIFCCMLDIDENENAGSPEHTVLNPYKFSKSKFI